MTEKPRLLVVEDNEGILRQIRRFFDSNGYSVVAASTVRDALEAAPDDGLDLALIDVRLPDGSGLDILQHLRRTRPETPVVMMTAFGDVQLAVQVMREGAADFITKPFEPDALLDTVRRHQQPHELSRQRGQVRERVTGESPQMKAVWEQVGRFAHTNISILLQGESGTGKELIARAIHRMSPYRDGPFVPLDCASLPRELVESEIFGYERGAFTGATGSKPGRIEMANEGTLFLDEIGNLPLDVQAKLLRVLQEHKLERLGTKTKTAIDLDFRVVAATNVDLQQAVANNSFREDLYYRINAVTLMLPPLREREGDVELVARTFLRRYAQQYGQPARDLSPEAVECLSGYTWPGNIRELENAMKVAVLNAGPVVDVGSLPDYLRARPCTGPAGDVKVTVDLNLNRLDQIDLKLLAEDAAAQAEAQVIRTVLRVRKLNRTDLAKFLNVDPKTLRSKLRQFDLD